MVQVLHVLINLYLFLAVHIKEFQLIQSKSISSQKTFGLLLVLNLCDQYMILFVFTWEELEYSFLEVFKRFNLYLGQKIYKIGMIKLNKLNLIAIIFMI